MRKIILGHFINPLSDVKAELILDGALIIQSGKIKELSPLNKIQLRKTDQVLDYTGHLVLPAFFDMHFHWVQDDVREMPKANLLQWLENYTFPAEMKYSNKDYAKKQAKVFFQRLVDVGTLGGACYSSIHEHALEYAMDHIKGDFVLGNVLMTMNSPKKLTQSKKEATDIVARMSSKYKKRYALTPRFAIATDPDTMLETAKLIKGKGCFIQTHLSETPNEIDFVTKLYKGFDKFKKVETYTEIYHKVNHLGPRTIMGHGIHLKESELKLLAKTKTAIAHCPTSNAPIKEKGLGSGLFDFRKVEKFGLRWALASDIGGGPFLSMLDVMRSFVLQNRKAGVRGATYTKALFRATKAGADILRVKAGSLDKGREANFVILPKITKLNGDTAEKILKRALEKKARSKLDQLPKATFYQGTKISN